MVLLTDFRSRLTSTNTILLTATALSAAIALTSLKLHHARRKRKKPPPKSHAGMMETLREMAGTRTPFFMLDQARLLGSMNYRLNMPFSAVVIGDAETARLILSDSRNDKPVEMMKSFDITLGGTNMFTQLNEKARITRKHTSRAFASTEIRGRMRDICCKCIDGWIETVLEPAIERGATIDPCREMLGKATYALFKHLILTTFLFVLALQRCGISNHL
jgi:hypothetical protein